MGFVDNPVITSPFEKPAFHYELDEEGQPTGVKLRDRRESIQIVPVPAARRRGPRQAELDLFSATGSRVTRNALVKEIRGRVDAWRKLPSSQWGVTPETQRLLLHWKDPSRARRLFFCQIEAVETLIYLTEVGADSLSQANRGGKRGGEPLLSASSRRFREWRQNPA
jgi:type III restriction enzyme